MKTLLTLLAIVLSVPHAVHAQATQAHEPEFELIRRVAAGAGPEADPDLARAAFEETLADAAVARLYGTAPMVTGEDRVLEALAAATADPASARALAEKLSGVAKGANPFDEQAAGVERALAALCYAEAVEDRDDPATAIDQSRRFQTALEAARAAHSSVLTVTCLAWLGLYAFQGGDMMVARRYLSEAATLAERSDQFAPLLTAHRYLSLSYALESNTSNALREAELAERIVAAGKVPPATQASVGPALYGDLSDYALGLGDRAKATEYARRKVALLEKIGAAASDRAMALERLGQLYAQTASDSPDDARQGSAALGAAADLHAGAGAPDRAVIDYTAAAVLLVENASGAEARPLLEKALTLSSKPELDDLRVGVEYWLGRSYLASAARAEPKDARAAFNRGVALIETALRRLGALERKGSPSPSLRATLNAWLGRAWVEGPQRTPRLAALYFQRAADALLEAGDVNAAVEYGEYTLRLTLEAGKPVDRLAADLFDRVVAGGRIDPLNAASALASELQRQTDGAGVAPSVVTFYEHVAASVRVKQPERAAEVEGALVLFAARERDRTLLSTRAAKAFDALVAAKRTGPAETLAEAVWDAWTAIGNAAEAAGWRARYEPLAEVSFEAAHSDPKRVDVALHAAEGLWRAAEARSDTAAAEKWSGAVAVIRRAVAGSLEEQRRLGLALDAWRSYADVLVKRGEREQARSAYDHAAAIASGINDREGRAESLVGRARVELELGAAKEALASSSEAVSLTTATDDGDGALPSVAQLVYPKVAVEALGVYGAACDALAASASSAADREHFTQLARDARSLAAEALQREPRQ